MYLYILHAHVYTTNNFMVKVIKLNAKFNAFESCMHLILNYRSAKIGSIFDFDMVSVHLSTYTAIFIELTQFTFNVKMKIKLINLRNQVGEFRCVRVCYKQHLVHKINSPKTHWESFAAFCLCWNWGKRCFVST